MATGKFVSYLRVSTDRQERAQNLRAIIEDVKAAGITSVRAIADELNHRAILTPRGGQWHATSVVRMLERLAA
jgi:DNA invertase Pin-like site-specific DNA recombinase